ncbi:MAG: hypothetical protein M9919_05860 [Burkholderiaceae bacterium]|jgi:hypothetical protein|nr:hypothetical protein [Burkholderiaceae bacterium]MCO5117961.1 hypothetical protein [Burkholderiaceae bacterium]
MKTACTTRRGAWLALAAAALVLGVNPPLALARSNSIAITSIAPFDAESWTRLVEKGPRPAAYLFTTRTCRDCPDTFEQLRSFVMDAHRPVELAAVVMDAEGLRAIELGATRYLGLTRLYAFHGDEAALRRSVDPEWTGAAPYIVLLGRDGSLQRSVGLPSPAMLKLWLP